MGGRENWTIYQQQGRSNLTGSVLRRYKERTKYLILSSDLHMCHGTCTLTYLQTHPLEHTKTYNTHPHTHPLTYTYNTHLHTHSLTHPHIIQHPHIHLLIYTSFNTHTTHTEINTLIITTIINTKAKE